MLKNNWYVAGESAEISKRPKRVKMLGQYFAVFRDDSGRPACVHDVCPHRGASLGRYGKVVDGRLECPYHGWQFDHAGRCTRVPSLPSDQPIAKSARVESYPTEERYGLIWVFVGDLPATERPPLPDFPEWDDDSFRMIHGRFFWRANYLRVVENGLDVAHAAFVHSSSFGNRDNPEVGRVEVNEQPWGAFIDVELVRPPVRGVWRLLQPSGRPNVKVRAQFQVAGMSIRLHQVINPKMELCLWDVNTPVDEHHTQTYWVAGRRFMTNRIFDFDARRRTMVVFEQDRIIVEDVSPTLAPELSQECSVKSDALQIAVRKKIRALAERGRALDAQPPARGSCGMAVIAGPTRRADDLATQTARPAAV